MSDQEDFDKRILVCLRYGAGEPVRGAVVMHCQTCQHRVWVAPSSIMMAGPDTEICCTVCVEGRIGSFSEVEPVTAAQAQEVREEVKRRMARARYHP